MTAHTANHEMTRQELHAKIQLFEIEAAKLRRIDEGCFGCIHSHGKKDGTCTQWNQTVPVEARKAGCDEWRWDEIPF